MHWRIWYSDTIVDGSTFEEWQNAPYDDVQAVAVFFGYDLFNRKLGAIFSGADWYWMTPDTTIDSTIINSDEVNTWIENPAPINAISKRGKYTTDENITRINNLIVEWVN